MVSFIHENNHFSLPQVHKKKLERIDIEDDLLIKLTELPHNAFELYVDENGVERLRIKESYQNEFLKMIRSKMSKNLNHGLRCLIIQLDFVSFKP